MIIQYIKRGNRANYPNVFKSSSPIGALVAFRENGIQYVGYSLLCPQDAQEKVEYRRRVKAVNHESHLKLKNGEIDSLVYEEPPAFFDKKDAVKRARAAAVPVNELRVPNRLSKKFNQFVNRLARA